MSTLRCSWICHRCTVLGAAPVVDPGCWNCGGPITVTARTTPSGVDNQMSGVVAPEGRAA
jgi:hypothetical protein